ncbi:hypothetical protein MYCTH_2141041 [Thermothelomyces thermophilus ATCC 42464]|uniref:Histidine acid phosphatase-like protein n=1 Tax=Thermothelomyces thermophilus (strain ATCC 42464 / BCRC 31852 / DSM 1799) TaxID=573729 RepID=G2QQF6_THET4|nr:uncharacterized protein MYCTH_2141041 [Thermothelomyces thermophilus ATCC 42464]AEO61819.1 hypothetical protein MYCTH_2141041 [Thermothelomyces thermophilus ATCC 42464]
MAPSPLPFMITLLMSTALARSDNEQLHVESSTDRCASASAIAFMQGLYPPIPHAACDSDVPNHHWLSNGSILNNPLNGYQYPNIRTLAPDRDPDSIWVFSEAFPLSQTNFYNAHELYDCAAYRWNHESSSASAMTSDDLEALRQLAWQEQSLKYGHSDNVQRDSSFAIAGRTLASRVAAIFAENIESRGERNKLSLAFTTHEPFLGFFALANLTVGPSNHLFSQLPNPGATLTFELFSVDEPVGSHNADSSKADASYPVDHYNKTSGSHRVRARLPTSRNSSTISPSFPDTDHLYVRCLYQNPDRYNYSIKNGNSTRELTPCPLFDNTHTAIPFKHFNAIVSAIGIADAASWCNACGSGDTVFFCKGAEPRTERQQHHLLAALAGSAGTLLAVSLIGFLE